MTGLGPKFMKMDQGAVVTPNDLEGTAYVVVTNDGTKVDERKTVAGPAVAMFCG